MFPEFCKDIRLVKVEEGPNGLAVAYGIATAEVLDKDGEICDYKDTAPMYKAWSAEAQKTTAAAGQEISLGNVRLQHDVAQIAGKVTKIEFDDANKQIWIATEAVDERISNMLRRGFVRGFSQGGKYLYRRCNECSMDLPVGKTCPSCRKQVAVRYGARPSEVSYVDNPCVSEATFAYVKADGTTELRKFATAEEAEIEKKEKPKCPHCGSKEYTLLPADFETAKCKKCGKTWDHGIVPGINDPYGDKVQKCAGSQLVGQAVTFTTRLYPDVQLEGTVISHYKADVADEVIEFLDIECLDGEHDGMYRGVRVDKTQPRETTGKFTCESSGPVHDTITGYGYAHTRTGTATTHGASEAKRMIRYQHSGGGSIELCETGGWRHDDGKGRTTSGTDAPSLWAHLESCHKKSAGAQDDVEKQAEAAPAAKEVVMFPTISEERAGRLSVLFTGVRKDMYHISALAQLLQSIKYLQQNVAFEGEREGDDRDVMIAVNLGAWLETGVSILNDIVADETSELLAAAKAVTKGDETMKINDSALAKTAHKANAGYFKKAAKYHADMAASHADAQTCHTEMAEACKEACAKCEGKDDAHLKAQQAFHEKMAAHHEKLNKQHASMCAHSEQMHQAHAEAEKAIAVEATEEETEETVEKAEEKVEEKTEEKPVEKTEAPTSDVAKLLAGFEAFQASLTKLSEKLDTVAEKQSQQPQQQPARHVPVLKAIGRDGKEIEDVQQAEAGLPTGL